MTKDELITKLRESGADAVSKIRTVPESAWGEGRYENGWNARQILAHVASIEWTYPRLIDLAQPRSATATGGGAKETSGSTTTTEKSAPAATTSAPPTRAMGGGVNSYNDRQVQKRSSASVDELIAEFEKNRAATIAAFKSVNDAAFSAEIQSAGGLTGTLADVVNVLAIEHVRGHVADIVGTRSGS